MAGGGKQYVLCLILNPLNKFPPGHSGESSLFRGLLHSPSLRSPHRRINSWAQGVMPSVVPSMARPRGS